MLDAKCSQLSKGVCEMKRWNWNEVWSCQDHYRIGKVGASPRKFNRSVSLLGVVLALFLLAVAAGCGGPSRVAAFKRHVGTSKSSRGGFSGRRQVKSKGELAPSRVSDLVKSGLASLSSASRYGAEVVLMPVEAAMAKGTKDAISAAMPIPMLVFQGPGDGKLSSGIGQVKLSEVTVEGSGHRSAGKKASVQLDSVYGSNNLWFKLPKESSASAGRKDWLEFPLSDVATTISKSPSADSVLWFALASDPLIWSSVASCGQLHYRELPPPGIAAQESNREVAGKESKEMVTKQGNWYGAVFSWSNVVSCVPSNDAQEMKGLGLLAFEGRASIYVDIGPGNVVKSFVGVVLEKASTSKKGGMNASEAGDGTVEGLEVVIHPQRLSHAVRITRPSAAVTEGL